MKNLLQDFIDLLYPAVCPGCGEVYATNETNLCLSCELDLPLFQNEQPVENILGGRVPIKAAAIYLKFYSGGQTQRLLHQIKYKGNRRLAEFLGERFMLAVGNQHKFAHTDIVIPIPLHEAKYRQRGYNQSALIATGIGKILAKPIEVNSVFRVARSETQTRKSREARWTNVKGIFSCHKDCLSGKHILLVDDVITTGATMEACAQAILDSGAASISFAALATAM